MGLTFILKIINAIILVVAFVTAIVSLAYSDKPEIHFDGDCNIHNCNIWILLIVYDILLMIVIFFMVFNSFFDFLKKWVPLTFLTIGYTIITIGLGVATLFIAGLMGFIVGILVIVWGVVILLLLIFAAPMVAVAEATE